MKQRYCILDYETRSKADLKKVGAYDYARDPSTEIICLGYRFGTRETLRDAPVHLWEPLRLGEFAPDDLLEALRDPGVMFVAHNALFEQVITRYVLAEYYGFARIDVAIERWICTASLAAALSLPRRLEDVGLALGTKVEKDMVGHRLMLRCSKPKKPSKKDPSIWDTDDDKLKRVGEYCRDDIEVETELFLRLRPLSPTERRVWLLDQYMNQSGIAIDRDAVLGAIALAGEAGRRYTAELSTLTDGEITSPNQVARIREYLVSECGLHMESLAAPVIRETLESGIDSKARRILKIRQLAGKTSTKKLAAFDARSRIDGRIRDILMYHGAATGRWCLTPDHEVLTPAGWQRIDTKPPAILQWSPTDNGLYWHDGTEYFEGPYNGVLATFENPRVSAGMTPEHTVPVFSSRGNFRSDYALALFSRRFDVPVSGFIKKINFVADVQTRVIVMTQADGHFSTDKSQGRFLRFRFKKRRKIVRCESLLKAARIPYRKAAYDCGTTIVVYRCNCPDWLWAFHEKQFGPAILKTDPKVFISELAKWDGHQTLPGSFEYSTTSENNAKWAATMAHLAGWAARVVPRPRQNPNWATAYRVYIKKATRVRVSAPDWQPAQYSGPVYCPKTSTGYFLVRHNGKISITGNSGAGVQVQNLPRGNVSVCDEVFDALRAADYDTTEMFGDPLDVISSALRGLIVPSPGNEFFVGDWSAIEARLAAWLAGQDDMLADFAAGRPIYEGMGAKIYRIPIERVDGYQRQVGKFACLGLQYGMGRDKFQVTGKDQFGIEIDAELAERAVKTYREVNYKIVQAWATLERGAIAAVLNPTKRYKVNRVTWGMAGKFLACELPSGRKMFYYGPEVRMKKTPWGEAKRTLYHYTVNTVTRKWNLEGTYGGRLLENVTQAASRDVMADAMLRLHGTPYRPVFTVHDEIASEAIKGRGDLEQFTNLLAASPAWADGLPLAVGCWQGDRYKKD